MKPRGLVFPDEVNVSPHRLVWAMDVMRIAIEEGVMPGATVCAFRRGQMFLFEALGTLDNIRPVSPDTIYDLASLTKPMVTSTAVLMLVEQGKLNLSTNLQSLFGARAAALGPVTIHHLLTHTSGLPAWAALYESGMGLESAVRTILRQPVVPPSTKYEYTCLGYILLGYIVEMLSEQSLDSFSREHIFIPLGLNDTTYLPDDALKDRIAPTHSNEGTSKGELLTGIVHDGNARGIGGVSGNAGLFGTARDVAVFGEMLRRGPSIVVSPAAANLRNDTIRRPLSTASLQLMGTALGEAIRRGPTNTSLLAAPTFPRLFTNQIDPAIGSHTCMFFGYGNGYCPSGDLLSAATIGHSGFTGTFLTIDPTYELVVVALTNRVFNEEEDGARWLKVRRRFLNVLAASLF